MKIIDNESREFSEALALLDAIEKSIEAHALETLRKDWLRQEEVCDWLQVCPRTLANLRDQGLLPHSKVAKKVYYREADVLALMEAHYRGRF